MTDKHGQNDSDARIHASDEGKKKGWRFWSIFIALCIATVVCALDMSSMATALPSIVHDFGGTESFAWVSTVYALSTAAILPLCGRLAEIFGRREVLLGSLVCFALGSLICALARSMVTLIIGRAIQGLGSGMIQTLAQIVLADLVTLKERGFFTSLTGAAFTAATGAGPFIGGAIVQKTTWRWMFYMNLPMCGIAIAVVYAFLHLKSPPRPPWRESVAAMDLIGNTIIIGATTSCIIALTWAGVKFPWSSFHVLLPLVVGLVGLFAAVLYERFWSKNPSIPFSILSNRTSISGYFSSFLHGLVITIVTFYLPIYFQAAKAKSPLLAGLYVFPTVILISPSAIIQGLLIAKYGQYRLINLIGWAATLLGTGLFCILRPGTSVGISVPFQMIVALGLGFGFATSFSVLAPLDPTLNSAALSFLMFVRTFPKSWGVAIGATLLQNDLKSALPSSFISQFTTQDDLTYVAVPLIPTLPDPIQLEVRDAFSQGLRLLWKVTMVLSAIGFLSVLGQKEMPLHTKRDTKWGMKDSNEKSGAGTDHEANSSAQSHSETSNEVVQR